MRNSKKSDSIISPLGTNVDDTSLAPFAIREIATIYAEQPISLLSPIWCMHLNVLCSASPVTKVKKMSQVGSLVSSLLRGHGYYPLINWDNPPSTPWAPDARSIVPEGWAFLKKKQMVIGHRAVYSPIYLFTSKLNLNTYTDYTHLCYRIKYIIQSYSPFFFGFAAKGPKSSI